MSPNTSTITGTYKSRRRHRGHIIIPTTANTYAKIIIVDGDGVNHTIADTYGGAESNNHLISGTYVKNATDKLSTFNIRIVNDYGRFLNKFTGAEIVKIYSDETDATTLKFYGKIDDVNYGFDSTDGFYVDIDGRDYPEIVDTTVTGSQDEADGNVALASILNEFYSDVKLEFWNGSVWAVATYDEDAGTVSWTPSVTNFPTTTITMAYQHKKGLTVIAEILKRLGMDSYLRYDESGSQWYLRTFVNGDITSSLAIAYGINLINLGESGTDNSEISNKIIAYGKSEGDNIILLKTEEDTTSQSNLWTKERIINVSDTDTMEEIEAKSKYELSEGIKTTPTGRFVAVNLSGLNPGEKIECDVPYCNVVGLYKTFRISHNLINFYSTVEVTKEIKKVEALFKEIINPDEIEVKLSNSNNMKDSLSVYFIPNEDKMIHENTEEVDGMLKLESGETTGTTTARAINVGYTVTECELRTSNNSLIDNNKYWVRVNNEEDWEVYDVPEGSTHTFTNSGTRPEFRIELNRAASTDSSPAYFSVCMLVK